MWVHPYTWLDIIDIVEPTEQDWDKCRSCKVAALCLASDRVYITKCNGCGVRWLRTDGKRVTNRDEIIACVSACDRVHEFQQTCDSCSAGEFLKKMEDIQK